MYRIGICTYVYRCLGYVQMLNSGMPKLSYGDIQYVRDALLPEATDIEATSAFTRSVII